MRRWPSAKPRRLALHLPARPVGCGVEIADEQQISAAEYERILNWMYDAEMEEGTWLKPPAPHYFRIAPAPNLRRRQGLVRQRPGSMDRQDQAGGHGHGGHRGHGNGDHPGGRHPMNAATKGCLAGTGVLYQPPRRSLSRLLARRGR